MFKRTKLNNKDESAFSKPILKKSREIKTHTKEKTNFEKIFYNSTLNLKRKTMFRMVLELSKDEIDSNIYLLTDIILKTLIVDDTVDTLFYKALSRIVESKKSSAIRDLCIDYLKAQLSSDQNYLGYAEFIIRNFKDSIIKRREEIFNIVKNDSLKQKIHGLKMPNQRKICDSSDSIYFLR